MSLEREPNGGLPRWIKVLGIIVLALVLVLLIGLHVIGGGMRGLHGP